MDIMKRIKEFALNNGVKVYIVGGYIRDKLMNSRKMPEDIDLVCSGDVKKLVQYIHEEGYNKFPLKEQLGIYRLTKGNNIIDVSVLKGKSIEEDLEKRDFTVNAIALDIINNKIIDPFQGRKHIQARIIKEVNKNSIKDDRVRILRAIRLIIKYGMHFSSDTEISVKNESKYLNECTKERVFEEIMKIIALDKDAVAIDIMDDYEVLKNLIPYVEEHKKIGKCKYHIEDAFTHMNMVYKVFKQVLKGEIELKGFELEMLNKIIGNYSLREYVAFAAFNHDIGKYKCYKKEGDKVSFKKHERVGAEIINDFCNFWLFPKEATNIIVNIVDGHMYPLGLFKSKLKEYKKSYYKFFKKYHKNIPYILLVSFCDVYATDIFYDPNNERDIYKEFIEELIEEFNIYESIKKNKIIRGDEIKENFPIEDKYIGEVLEYVDEMAYTGNVESKEQTMKKISKWCIINKKFN